MTVFLVRVIWYPKVLCAYFNTLNNSWEHYEIFLICYFIFVMSVTISACSVRLYLQLFVRGFSCLIYVIYVCLRIGVSNTYCVVFLFCSSYISYVARFSRLSFLICLFGILWRLFKHIYSSKRQKDKNQIRQSSLIIICCIIENCLLSYRVSTN